MKKTIALTGYFPIKTRLAAKVSATLSPLPLQGEARKRDNTVFLDPDANLLPFADQWELLKLIKRVPIAHLDKLHALFNSAGAEPSSSASELSITVGNMLFLNKSFLPKILINYLKDTLNFLNSDFLIKKKIGASVYKVGKYFKLIQTFDDTIAIPRGFLHRLTDFLKEKHTEYKIDDRRLKLDEVKFENSIKLFPHQVEAVDKMIAVDAGVLVAPPGSGKTIIGLDIIAKQKQPALILTNKKQIFNQWLERIEGFLNLPKRQIGQYTSNKKKLGEKITVAMVQTLNNAAEQELAGKFGLILVDEYHHMPAKMFRNVITRFNPYFLYGLTATPKRKNNDTDLIFFFLGDIIHTMPNSFGKPEAAKQSTVVAKSPSGLKVIIRETDLSVPFKVKTDNVQMLYKIITFDTARNKQIIADIKREAEQNKRCLILTERKEHVDVLNSYLKREYETIILTGDLTEKQRRLKVKQIQAGHFQILIATGQLIGEGTDFNNLDCLFLAFPFAFEGKLTQYIGRINRGLNTGGTIYDYNDSQVEYLKRFFKKRNAYYRKNFECVQ
ncbi:MAG: DEAD/DEAH box helicase family protein [Patescibacteria group bacterium]